MAAMRWGEARESEIRAAGQPKATEPPKPKTPVMTVAELAPRFVNDYARADGHGEGGIEAKESILRLHIVPHIGEKKLDEVNASDVQALKHIWLAGVVEEVTGNVLTRPTNRIKTLNNRLTVLAKMLKVAVDWKELIGLTALTDALLAVLLGAEAGLRRPRSEPSSPRPGAPTSSATRSARISRWRGRPSSPSRTSPGTRTWKPRWATCT